jgi:hypothetical protein
MIEAMSRRRGSSHHEEIIHPNEEKERSTSILDEVVPGSPFHWPSSRFVRWFLVFDEEKLRPFFIRNYDRAVALLEDEY